MLHDVERAQIYADCGNVVEDKEAPAQSTFAGRQMTNCPRVASECNSVGWTRGD